MGLLLRDGEGQGLLDLSAIQEVASIGFLTNIGASPTTVTVGQWLLDLGEQKTSLLAKIIGVECASIA